MPTASTETMEHQPAALQLRGQLVGLDLELERGAVGDQLLAVTVEDLAARRLDGELAHLVVLRLGQVLVAGEHSRYQRRRKMTTNITSADAAEDGDTQLQLRGHRRTAPIGAHQATPPSNGEVAPALPDEPSGGVRRACRGGAAAGLECGAAPARSRPAPAPGRGARWDTRQGRGRRRADAWTMISRTTSRLTGASTPSISSSAPNADGSEQSEAADQHGRDADLGDLEALAIATCHVADRKQHEEETPSVCNSTQSTRKPIVNPETAPTRAATEQAQRRRPPTGTTSGSRRAARGGRRTRPAGSRSTAKISAEPQGDWARDDHPGTPGRSGPPVSTSTYSSWRRSAKGSTCTSWNSSSPVVSDSVTRRSGSRRDRRRKPPHPTSRPSRASSSRRSGRWNR